MSKVDYGLDCLSAGLAGASLGKFIGGALDGFDSNVYANLAEHYDGSNGPGYLSVLIDLSNDLAHKANGEFKAGAALAILSLVGFGLSSARGYLALEHADQT